MILAGQVKKLYRGVEILKRQSEVEENEGLKVSPGALASGGVTLHHSTVAGLRDLVPPGMVDAVITFPLAGERDWWRLADLAGFGAHALKITGGLFVLAGTENLPAFIEHLKHPELQWICALHYTHPGSHHVPRALHRIPVTQKLVLVFGKSKFRSDAGYSAITVPPLSEGTGRENLNRRLGTGFEIMIERFTHPNHTVVDPIMAGRFDSALAAVKMGRSFIGAWEEGRVIDRLRARLDVEASSGEDQNPDGLDTQTGQ